MRTPERRDHMSFLAILGSLTLMGMSLLFGYHLFIK